MWRDIDMESKAKIDVNRKRDVFNFREASQSSDQRGRDRRLLSCHETRQSF